MKHLIWLICSEKSECVCMFYCQLKKKIVLGHHVYVQTYHLSICLGLSCVHSGPPSLNDDFKAYYNPININEMII